MKNEDNQREHSQVINLHSTEHNELSHEAQDQAWKSMNQRVEDLLNEISEYTDAPIAGTGPALHDLSDALWDLEFAAKKLHERLVDALRAASSCEWVAFLPPGESEIGNRQR